MKLSLGEYGVELSKWLIAALIATKISDMNSGLVLGDLPRSPNEFFIINVFLITLFYFCFAFAYTDDNRQKILGFPLYVHWRVIPAELISLCITLFIFKKLDVESKILSLPVADLIMYGLATLGLFVYIQGAFTRAFSHERFSKYPTILATVVACGFYIYLLSGVMLLAFFGTEITSAAYINPLIHVLTDFSDLFWEYA